MALTTDEIKKTLSTLFSQSKFRRKNKFKVGLQSDKKSYNFSKEFPELKNSIARIFLQNDRDIAVFEKDDNIVEILDLSTNKSLLPKEIQYNFAFQIGYVEDSGPNYTWLTYYGSEGQTTEQVASKFRTLFITYAKNLDKNKKKDCCKKLAENEKFCSNCGEKNFQLDEENVIQDAIELLRDIAYGTWDSIDYDFQCFLEENGFVLNECIPQTGMILCATSLDRYFENPKTWAGYLDTFKQGKIVIKWID